MSPSSKRKNSEASSQISKKKRTTKEPETRPNNPSEELKTTGHSTTNDISNVSNGKPAPLFVTTTLSEWHVPNITGGDVYYVPEVIILPLFFLIMF